MDFEDKLDLIGQAIVMYLKKEDERKIKGENFKGVLYNTGKDQLFVCFYGRQFRAEIDTNDGKARLEFLITEYKRPDLN